MFKRRRFPVETLMVCVRWYYKYGISYRDLSEMMLERGVEVGPSTTMRWVHRYAPEPAMRIMGRSRESSDQHRGFQNDENSWPLRSRDLA